MLENYMPPPEAPTKSGANGSPGSGATTGQGSAQPALPRLAPRTVRRPTPAGAPAASGDGNTSGATQPTARTAPLADAVARSGGDAHTHAGAGASGELHVAQPHGAAPDHLYRTQPNIAARLQSDVHLDEPHGLSGAQQAESSEPAEKGPALPALRVRSLGANSLQNATRAAQAVPLRTLRDEARAAFREALAVERSGIPADQLEAAPAHVRSKVHQIALEVAQDLKGKYARNNRAPLTDAAAGELARYLEACQFGAGALEPLFSADDVEDICINTRTVDGETQVEVFTFRAGGKVREVEIDVSVDEVIELANRHAAGQGRSLNTANPVLNAQMKSGARLNAVMNPVCDGGVAMTIRLHRLVARTFDDLVERRTLTVQAANYLHLMTQCGVSMVVAGGTGSGKTNLLNAIARSMPQDLRCVVIEDTRELQLALEDVVYLRTVEARDERAVNQRKLAANALRMRPDRLIVGEVRDGAAWDAIKATNTGHQGTLLTIHAEDAHSVVARLMQLCAEASETAQMSESRLIETISSAFRCVVFIERNMAADGSMQRTVTQITDQTGQITDGRPQQVDLYRMQNGVLTRTAARPSAGTLKLFARAGLSETQVLEAMASEEPLWRNV